MRKQKLHLLPLQTTFLNKIQTGVHYYSRNHYVNFGDNSLEVISFHDTLNDEDCWPTNLIFEKVLTTMDLYNAKYLSKLKITIQASFLCKTSVIRHFRLCLARHFKTLKQLDLRFLSCKKLNSANLRHLLDSLTNGMMSLTEVNVYFLACPDVDDQCLEDLKLSVVKRCKSLRKLKVIFAREIWNLLDRGFLYFEPDLYERLQNNGICCWNEGLSKNSQITSKGGRSFCQGIAQYLKKLRSFTFRMEAFQKEDRHILKMLASLSNLENLNLSFSRDLEIDDAFLWELISCFEKNMKRLQSLSLDFPFETPATERGYQLFARNLFSSLPPLLAHFALSLESQPVVTDDIIREMDHNIAKNLRNLQTLILNFGDSMYISEKALLGLIQTISQSPSLKKLYLSFEDGSKVNPTFPLILPKHIEEFGLYLTGPQFRIHETWKNLNRLSLSFADCREMINLGGLFSDPSLSLKNLSELKLLYARSCKSGDEDMKKLVSYIGNNLENLTSLGLGFSECSLLTSKFCFFWGHHICRKLKKLRHLNFTLIDSDESDYPLSKSLIQIGFVDLTAVITSLLGNLESLTLNFYDLNNVIKNKEEILGDFLCTRISLGLKKLRKLTLIFGLYKNIELKRRIRRNLRHIPILEIH